MNEDIFGFFGGRFMRIETVNKGTPVGEVEYGELGAMNCLS